MWLKQLLVFLLCSGTLWAEVARIEIQERSDVLGGRAFGLAGPYEKLVGKVYFAVDPSNPINQIIADIDNAPRNAAGQVEFSSDLYVLKPKNPERGNGAVLCGIPNRGRKVMLSFFNRASYSLDPSTGAEFGDGFLMRQGYTLVWLGWQWDPPPRPGLMRLYAPVARGIQGLVRADFVVTHRVTRHLLSDRNHIPYRVADPDDPQAILTVRDRVDSTRRLIPREQWKFSADRTSVEMSAGFVPHKIYEVVYTGKDPVLVGLGPTAVRDFLSHLKYGRAAAPGAPPQKPLIPGIRRAYAFGISQSGRFLRTFLYYGFNQDEAGRQVLDGVIPHVAGACRGSFNHRFAQPSRDAHPFMNFFYPTLIFPFTDVAQTDPETGLTDGLLRRVRKSATAPRIFHTNASYEYWGRAASLIHTSLDGKSDAPIPDNVRIYMFAGSQHGPAPFPPARTIGQQRDNPNDFRWAMRALLVALDRWVSKDEAPPPSLYPRLADGTLVSAEALDFPKITGVGYSTRVLSAYRADYGPKWKSGIVTREPPRIGKPFPVLVPQVDADGNETNGLRLPEVAVPLATYTGWNLFNERSGPPDEISSMAGSYIPFPRTRAERQRTGDPRRSIEERYHDRAQYLGMVAASALQLIEQRYLLDHDLPEILRQAAERWDHAAVKGR